MRKIFLSSKVVILPAIFLFVFSIFFFLNPTKVVVAAHCPTWHQTCPETWIPVCGADGQTYSSPCHAEAACVTVAYDGACWVCGDNSLNSNKEGDYNSQTCLNGWGLTQGNSSSGCWQNMCCGDDNGEAFVERRTDCSVDWAWATNPPTDIACCSDYESCVKDGVCYETEKPAFFGGGGHDQKVFCDRNNGWSDYDSSQGGRDPTCLDNYPYASDQCERDGVGKSTLSGESGVGEYDEHGLPYQCCGDDANEYYKTNSATGVSKCCANDSAVIDASGNCAYGPDLIVESLSATALMCVGQNATLYATIKNQGTANAGQSTTQLTLSDNSSCPAPLVINTDPINAGNSGGASCNITLTSAGSKTLTGAADYAGVITETDENNNTLDQTGQIVYAIPGAPQNLRETNITTNSITWDWDDVAGVSSYAVYLNDVYKTNTAASNYLADSLLPNTTYTLKVIAINTCGNSAATADSATTVNPGCPLPAAPSNLQCAPGATLTEIPLSWTDNSGDEMGFKIIRDNEDEGHVVGTTGSDGTSWTDSGRSCGVGYPYWVEATNACGDSSRDREDCDTADCVCGDGVCGWWARENPETCTTCPNDCGVCPTPCDNDGICDSGETNANCPADCPTGGGGDGINPIVTAFSIDTHTANFSVCDDASFTVAWTVSDSGGSGLSRVEIWRKDNGGDWAEVVTCRRTDVSGNGPVSGSCDDVVSATNGNTYEYGIHVLDGVPNLGTETLSGLTTITATESCGGGAVTADFDFCRYTADSETVQFLNKSTGATSYDWDFGDGSASCESAGDVHCTAEIGGHTFGTNTHPVHEFSLGGLTRRKITFDNSNAKAGITTETLTNFPVLIKLNSTRINYGNAQNNGQDLRFFDADGTTPLNFEIEEWNEAGDSFVWVKVPAIAANSTTDNIIMQYGDLAAADGQNPSGVWDSNYKMVLHLDEIASQGQHQDSTSNNNDSSSVVATPQGTATGQADGADELDGINDGIDIPNSGSLNPTTALTMEAWVKPTDLTTRDSYEIMRQQSDALDDGWYDSGTDTFKFFVFQNYGTQLTLGLHTSGYYDHNWETDTPITAADFVDGNWHYVVATFVSGWPRIYKDGAPLNMQGKNGVEYEGAIGTQWRPLTVGKYLDGNEFFKGGMDEVRFSDMARSGAWIKAQYLSVTDDFASFGAVGYVGNPQIAGATDNLSAVAPSEPAGETEGAKADKSNFFEKVWGAIKGAGEWVINLFQAEDTKAQSSAYSVVLTAHGAGGSATASYDVTPSSAKLCEFDLFTLGEQSCRNIGLRWEQLGDNDYDLYRCQNSNCSACNTKVDTIDGNTCVNNICETENSIIEGIPYCYYLAIKDIGLKNSPVSTNPPCSGDVYTCSVTTEACPTSDLTTASVCGKIILSWNAVYGSTGYKIQRAIGSNAEGNFSDLATLPAGVVSYEDKNVITVNTTKPATQFLYWYRVCSLTAPNNCSSWTTTSDGAYSYCYRGPGWEER